MEGLFLHHAVDHQGDVERRRGRRAARQAALVRRRVASRLWPPSPKAFMGGTIKGPGQGQPGIRKEQYRKGKTLATDKRSRRLQVPSRPFRTLFEIGRAHV